MYATSIWSENLLNSEGQDLEGYDIRSVPQDFWTIAVRTTNNFQVEAPPTRRPMVVVFNFSPTMVYPPGQDDRRCNHCMTALSSLDPSLIASTDYWTHLNSGLHATMPHCS